MNQRTHEQIAAELRSQLETVAAFLSAEELPPIDAATRIRPIQRLASRTFASQLWLCENLEDISKQIQVNRAGAKLFFPVANFVVESLSRHKDLTAFNFTEWGRFSLLSDAVTLYLKELEKTNPSD